MNRYNVCRQRDSRVKSAVIDAKRDQHRRGLKSTRATLCPWERLLTALSPAFGDLGEQLLISITSLQLKKQNKKL